MPAAEAAAAAGRKVLLFSQESGGPQVIDGIVPAPVHDEGDPAQPSAITFCLAMRIMRLWSSVTLGSSGWCGEKSIFTALKFSQSNCSALPISRLCKARITR